jgi:uncharacterized protein (DUF1330 family)
MATHVDPKRSQFEQFKALPRDQPIMMLNLVQLNDTAVYPDGTTTTGAAAYAAYGRESHPIFSGLGGEIIWRGIPQNMLIGPEEEHWDIAFIARYPDAASFLAMVTNPDYQKAVVHRQVAVKDSRLLRMSEAGEGQCFAE